MTNSVDKDGQTVITGNIDFNGNALILDVDADSKIEVSTDDRFDLTLGGVLSLSTTSAQTLLLDAIAKLAVTDSNIIVGNGTTWVAESGSTARTSLGVDLTTKGTILAGNGTVPTVLGASGANDYVLTADSAQATGLKWAASQNDRGMVLLAVASANNDATIDFAASINSSYDEYQIHILNAIPATDAVSLRLRTSTDGGANYDAGASDYAYTVICPTISSAQGTASTGAAQGLVCGDATTGQVGSAANETGVIGIVYLSRPSNAQYAQIYAHGTYVTDAGNSAQFQTGMQRLSAADINAIRLYFSSGNVESGLFKLYGVRPAL